MNSNAAKKLAPHVNPLSLDVSVASEPDRSEPVRQTTPRRRWPFVLAGLVVAAAAGAWYAQAWTTADRHASAGSNVAAGAGTEKTEKASLGYAADTAANKGPKQPAGARIEVVPLEVAPRNEVLRLTGSLVADERSSVASNTSGIAAEVLVDRGSVVRKGDVLVQIDPTDAQNKLAEGRAMLEELKARLGLTEANADSFDPEDEPEVRLAKASANLAEANLKRAREMFAKKVISAEAFDQTQTEYELAMQRYRQAKLLILQAYQACQTAMVKLSILEKAVADTTIRAPFDGWVAEKLVSVGEQISSGMQATKVVTLVRIDPLRLSLTVPQQSIGCIQPGQEVRFRVDSFPDRVFTAKVRFIAPVVTHDTRSMVVEALVPNPEGALRPGLFATAELLLPTQETEVFAPISAVQDTGEVARVFVVRDGVAREQVVALGEADKGKVRIRSGLSGKEFLVARPELVRDGDRIAP